VLYCIASLLWLALSTGKRCFRDGCFSCLPSYGSWIYNYLFNQCLLWIKIPFMRGVLDTITCDKICQWPAAIRLFSPIILVPSTNKADRHNTTEILLNVALSNITLTLTIVRSHTIQWPNRKKDKQTNNDQQNIICKDWAVLTAHKTLCGVNSDAPEGSTANAPTGTTCRVNQVSRKTLF
jgi:hypothetical protein